ncbi:hypothetical protein JCGZ_10182 [Jatropha curcas]|uniref:UBX domain-containing protein n=1 Tax=Jatropha curcas TaxID=180498 RepID=A0A067LD79_JATCU|nr:plant UBX domain-containing protein 1 [Jatropha curcas]XP_012071201.1 plant UBX domain-containing protein 1 [Jatropha curcas]KDP46342.1 hypothetical protein JCGZ_10182 [Jatropha curcas]
MFVDGSSPLPLKRRRLTTVDIMEAEAAKAKLAAVKEKFGRDIRVFETLGPSPSANQLSGDDESDDFYEFTAEDYYNMMALATKKEKGDKYLKTRKIREAEEAARRSKISKAVIRVRFPDNLTLEVAFLPSEKIQSLVDVLMKVVARPEVPFYLYTTPPKKQIKDFSVDFYSAGFVPGAIVYFSYDLPQGDDAAALQSGPFLQEEIVSLKGLEAISEPAEPVQLQPAPEPVTAAPTPVPQESKPAGKKPIKPKWLKM